MAEMTPERIAEIKARAAKATPGAWRFMRVEKPRRGKWYSDEILTTTLVAATYPGHQVRTDHRGGVSPFFDGEFIAHARQDIPDLLDALARAQQEIADLKASLEFMEAGGTYIRLADVVGATGGTE